MSARTDRINELARKAKVEELTEEDKLEQKALREEYIRNFRASMRGILNNTTIVSPVSEWVAKAITSYSLPLKCLYFPSLISSIQLVYHIFIKKAMLP